jgi:hypothetical protein
MMFIQLTAEYNPETARLEITLPPGIDPIEFAIKRHREDEDENGAYGIVNPSTTWTEEELDEIFQKPERAMTGKELVTWLEMTGGWEDLQITSGAEWSIEQRRRIEGRYKW